MKTFNIISLLTILLGFTSSCEESTLVPPIPVETAFTFDTVQIQIADGIIGSLNLQIFTSATATKYVFQIDKKSGKDSAVLIAAIKYNSAVDPKLSDTLELSNYPDTRYRNVFGESKLGAPLAVFKFGAEMTLLSYETNKYGDNSAKNNSVLFENSKYFESKYYNGQSGRPDSVQIKSGGAITRKIKFEYLFINQLNTGLIRSIIHYSPTGDILSKRAFVFDELNRVVGIIDYSENFAITKEGFEYAPDGKLAAVYYFSALLKTEHQTNYTCYKGENSYYARFTDENDLRLHEIYKSDNENLEYRYFYKYDNDK